MRRRLLAVSVGFVVIAACSGSDDTGSQFPSGPAATTATTSTVKATTPTTPAPVLTSLTTTRGTSGTTAPSVPVDTGPTANTAPTHPLDGLTADELQTFKAVLQADGKLDGSQFPYIALAEPDKQFVLAWHDGEAIPRRAFAVVRRNGSTFETVVDLNAKSIVSWTERPGAEPGYVNTEFSRAAGAARQDPRLLNGLAARGLSINDVICLMFAGGSARGPEEEGHRLGRITCYLNAPDPYYLSHPVEGLFATVDVDTGEVLSVTDTGPVAVPTNPPAADPQRQRPALTEIGFDASQGTNVTFSGPGVEWSGWTFRWRPDRRAGVELTDARFDGGIGARRVMYEAYLADLFVPYQDPDPAWAFRTLLDSAEFGLGTTLSQLTLGVDCPQHAQLLDALIPNDGGDGSLHTAAVCVFERPTGDPAWRHQGSGSDPQEGTGRPATELVMRWISTIGNYDYIIDYVFGEDGSFHVHVFAAGIVLQKGVEAPDEQTAHDAGMDDHGVLVGDGLVATNHDHYMSFRIDLDVDQTANEMVRAHMVPEPVTGDPGRTQIWTLDSQVVASEQGAMMTPDPEQPEAVYLQSSAANGPLGHHPAYELDFGSAVAVAPGDVGDEPGLRRGGWAEHTVWVTPYDPTEQFASGLYVPDGTQPAGLPAWTAQDRSLVDTDLVLWFTVGFHHIVRTEDLPTMPAHEAEFGLLPTNISPTNPFLDIG